MNELSKTPGLFDPGMLQTMGQLAECLAQASLLPEHLRGVKGTNGFEAYPLETRRANCMLVINAARLFGADPFQLANESYVLHGKLDFSGKVYAALANQHGGLAENISYVYEGQGDERQVIVSGRLSCEAQPRTLRLHYMEARTQDRKGNTNKQWADDRDQMLAYAGARKWVRRHCPQVLLGLVADDGDAESQPLATIDADAAASQAAIEDAGPSEKYRNIWDKSQHCKTRTDVKLLSNEVARARITDGERQQLLGHLRQKWVELTPDEEPPAADDQAYNRWVKTITTEPDAAKLDEYREQIGSDKSLTDDQALELDAMISTVLAGSSPA